MVGETKKEMIVAELRRRIAAGDLERGSRIHQQALASEFETSITPVREALSELQAEGLLAGEPRRGVRVASVDLEQVKGVYLLRRRIEPYAMARAALRVSRNDLAEASRLTDEMEESHAADDDAKTSGLNRRFHFVFYENSGPSSFVEEIRDLWLGFPWDILQVLTTRVDQSIADHRAIVQAIEDGDTDALVAASEAHLAGAYRSLYDHLAGPDGKPFVDPYDKHND